jgi:hypothetical protein
MPLTPGDAPWDLEISLGGRAARRGRVLVHKDDGSHLAALKP